MDHQKDDVFDFNAIEDVPDGDLRVKDATGMPTRMWIKLAGPEHPDRKRRLFARQRKFRAQFAKTNKMPVTDPAEEFDDQTDELVASTLGWEGAAVQFSPAAARTAYTDPKRQWLRQQVVDALAERELFTRSSAKP